MFRVNVSGIDVAVGEYVEIVPPERIVWTWGWEGSDTIPPGSSTVEVTLTADGDATVVHLRHSGLPDENAEQEHREGWTHYVARLGDRGSRAAIPGPIRSSSRRAEPETSLTRVSTAGGARHCDTGD